MLRSRWPLLVFAFIAAAACPLQAQDGYTIEQADRGDAVFRRICAQCHTASQFSGSGFRDGWNGRTVFELYQQIRTTMPMDNPGRLRREQYADVVAYLLRLNGQAPGTNGLDTDSVMLTNVQIRFATESRSP